MRRAWAAVLAVSLGLLGACAGTGRHASACPAGGCPVPVVAYVPLCHDADAGTGPCVDEVGGLWVYASDPAAFPIGRTLQPCRSDAEISGCVWVPSRMGRGEQGDSGAYIYP